jgi:hypothetical protein
MRGVKHVACMKDKTGTHRVLVGKPAGKRPHEKLMHRRIVLKWIFKE